MCLTFHYSNWAFKCLDFLGDRAKEKENAQCFSKQFNITRQEQRVCRLRTAGLARTSRRGGFPALCLCHSQTHSTFPGLGHHLQFAYSFRTPNVPGKTTAKNQTYTIRGPFSHSRSLSWKIQTITPLNKKYYLQAELYVPGPLENLSLVSGFVFCQWVPCFPVV